MPVDGMPLGSRDKDVYAFTEENHRADRLVDQVIEEPQDFRRRARRRHRRGLLRVFVRSPVSLVRAYWLPNRSDASNAEQWAVNSLRADTVRMLSLLAGSGMSRGSKRCSTVHSARERRYAGASTILGTSQPARPTLSYHRCSVTPLSAFLSAHFAATPFFDLKLNRLVGESPPC